MKKNRKRPEGRPRYKGRNYHHLTAYSNGGASSPDNELLIDMHIHKTWHKIFGNRSLSEVISLLQRLQRMKMQHIGKTYIDLQNERRAA